MSKPRIAILATGGTIAGVAANPAATDGYRSATLPIDALLAALPGLGDIAEIQAEQVAQLDSKDMSFAVWQRLDTRIRAWRDSGEVDGIVITHGTDSLEETAILLHLTQPAGIPVVLTAAMRPATAVSADGPLNLLHAVRVAAHPGSAALGVLVVVNQEIHAARDVVKLHTGAVQAFASPGCGPLGAVAGQQIRYGRRPVALAGIGGRLLGMPADWPWVEVIVSVAGARRQLVDGLVQQGVQGLVIAGPGNGSIHEALLPALADAWRQGVAVVRGSRSGAGYVTSATGVAAGGEHAAPGGFPATADLNPAKARVALMLALGTGEAGIIGAQGVPDALALQQFFEAI
ncbi:asparaginase [Imbroritus primus]|uniref:asparaginase n=1 Tax=Imbroritus primus TaxID=3058603 RepID=UPI003D16052E